MHRVSWDLHYTPVMSPDSAPHGEEAERGAVPHRTYPPVYAPWAPAGRYTVRLTVGGQRYTQPLVLRLDPRVRTSTAGLAELATLSRATYECSGSAGCLHGGALARDASLGQQCRVTQSERSTRSRPPHDGGHPVHRPEGRPVRQRLRARATLWWSQ